MISRIQLIAVAFLFSFTAGFSAGLLDNYRLLSLIFAKTGLPHDWTILAMLFALTLLPFLVFLYFGRKFDFRSRFVSTSLFLLLSCFSACYIGILTTPFLSIYLGYVRFSNIIETVILPGLLGAGFFSVWEFIIAFVGLLIGSSMRSQTLVNLN
jgi:hypothetical protein